jgi:hypothetical protein
MIKDQRIEPYNLKLPAMMFTVTFFAELCSNRCVIPFFHSDPLSDFFVAIDAFFIRKRLP